MPNLWFELDHSTYTLNVREFKMKKDFQDFCQNNMEDILEIEKTKNNTFKVSYKRKKK